MINLPNPGYMFRNRWCAVFLLWGLGIAVFCQLTILNRTADVIQDQQFEFIQQWVETGYFKLGGLRFDTMKDANSGQFRSKVSIPQTFLVLSFLTQKLFHSLTGQYSKRLHAISNLLIICVGGIFVGLLVFRILTLNQIEQRHAVILGMSAQLVYATFPWNVLQYLRVYPTAAFCILLCMYLLVQYPLPSSSQRFKPYATAFIVFMMTLLDPIATFFFMISKWLLIFIAKPKLLSPVSEFKQVILPIIAAFLLIKLQIFYVARTYPGIEFYGAGFMFRSGLDGSIEFFGSAWDLFSRNNYFPLYMYLKDFDGLKTISQPSLLTRWYGMFLLGLMCLAFSMWAAIWSKALMHTFMPLWAMVTAYILFAFVLNQAAITHPFVYDIYLYLPLVLLMFAGVPVIASQKFTYLTNSMLVAVLVIFSIAYSMVQLRTFSLSFPLPPDLTWLKLS